MELIHKHNAEFDLGAGASPALWKNFPESEVFVQRSFNAGYGIANDFQEAACVDITVDATSGTGGSFILSFAGAKVFKQGDGSVVTGANANGVLVLTSPTLLANGEVSFLCGWNVNCPFSVIPSTGGDLIFEARWKVSTVTATRADIFVGLAGAGAAANDGFIGDTDAIATGRSFLGFTRLGSASTSLSLSYERNGGTVASATGIATLAADTYLKTGFKWDALAKTLTPCVDGVMLPAKKIAATTTAATPWPDALMNLGACLKNANTTAATAGGFTLSFDWVRVGQKR